MGVLQGALHLAGLAQGLGLGMGMAMAQPMIGHLDPEFLAILDRVQGRLRSLFGTKNAMTLPLSTSARLMTSIPPNDSLTT